MSEPTKGPWRLREYKWGWVIAPEAEPDCLIVTAKYDSGVLRRTIERQQADGRLIAVAPELLAALEDVVADLEGVAEGSSLEAKAERDAVQTEIDAARAAIAKARGEESNDS